MTSAMWTEKYRPEKFTEIKGQNEIVKRVQAFVKQKNMPHLLFSGPAGTGKTSLSLVIAKQLFGPSWKQNFLELNASDTRGIDIIRNQVKDFARTKALGNVPFKIIYLDESDALTKEAQQALRRTMENYTKTARFILSCVTPETKILLPNEVEISISNFMKQYQDAKQIRVHNISEKENIMKNDLVLASVQLPPQSIGKKVFEIITMSGRKIKATEDHKLLTINGWKEVGSLKKNDSLLVYPSLEGTEYEDNNTKIIGLNKFIDFISNLEEKSGLKNIEKAKFYGELKNQEKKKIIKRLNKLKKIADSDKGLTEREYFIYNLIKTNSEISRKKIQDKIRLSRIRTNQLLKSIEEKGHIKRIINKKTHKFVISDTKPCLLRNYMHIKNIIQAEFKINMSYTAVKKALNDQILRGKVDRVIGELKRRNILDVTFNNLDKIGALARLCGFMLGDGHLVHNNIRFYFSGNKKALEKVKKDLDILGYSNYSKIFSKTLKNTIRGRTFEGTSTWFTLDSSALSALLQFLGIPKGDKTITKFGVPEFIKQGTRFVKREFLRALFGCDADKPNWKRMNFGAILLRQNKSIYLKKPIINYYNELSNLFQEFEIETYLDIRDRKEIRKRDNAPVLTFGLVIKPNNDNLFKFFSRIGYVYEDYKIKLARLSAEYLRHKCYLINSWKKKSELILAQADSGKLVRTIAREFEVTPDFVTNQRKGKEVHLPRKEFIDFDAWLKEYQYNDTLLINKIVEIKEIDSDIVMDITCHNDHNFITNGFISHNCNYSSKIIDPIQSRCAIFHFKSLKKEDIFSLIDHIAQNESLQIDPDAQTALFEISAGDCRRVENILQSSAVISPHITKELIYSLVSFAQPKEIKALLELALKNKFIPARNKLIAVMLQHGLSGLDLIKQIQKEIWNLDIADKNKVKLINHCGEIEFRMVEGADEFVQLESFLAYVVLVGSK